MSTCAVQASNIATPWQVQFTTLGNGTNLKAYPQDSSVNLQSSHLNEVEDIYFQQFFTDGPADKEMKIAQNMIKRDDFMKVKPGTSDFDSGHTFACVREATNMWRATLEILKATFKNDPKVSAALKMWDSMPHGQLYISPEGIPNEKNAYYSRSEVRIINGKEVKVCELLFGSFMNNGKKVLTCRSKDIVAHETGHYCLDRVRGQFYDSKNIQTGAFHEAFGDITAFSSIVDGATMAQALINATQGNLHSYNNFAARLAEEFGVSLGLNGPLRNMDSVHKMSTSRNEVHAIAEVFSTAYYTMLVRCFEDIVSQYQTRSPRLTSLLQDVSEYGRTLVMGAIIDVKDDPNFSDFGAAFAYRAQLQRTQAPERIGYLKDLKWGEYLINELSIREITVPKQIYHNFTSNPVEEYNGHICTAYHRFTKNENELSL